jgi:NADH:ubiquinone oxidoreductase subunit C
VQVPYQLTVLSVLKNHSLFLFKQLTELAIIDNPANGSRFKLNYIVTSLKFNSKLIVSVELSDLQQVASLFMVYESAE